MLGSIRADTAAAPHPAMHPTDRRRIVTAIAILLAVPGYVICGLQHVCMAGHMQHPVYPPIHWLNDVGWLCAMVVAAVFCWKSNLRFKRSVFFGLIALAASRLLLGSGGSLFFLIEIPILAGVTLAALIGLKFPDIDRAGWTKQEWSAHRRNIIHKWVISIGAGAFAVLTVFAAIKIIDVIRKKSAERIEITANSIPFKREITLKSGEAVVLVLPNQKTLAVWCEKPSGILRDIHGGRARIPLHCLHQFFPAPGIVRIPRGVSASLQYGEQPFTSLEREEIALPGGGTTTGEYKSYIRQGPVMEGNLGRTREYILYVNPFRISLDEQEVTTGLRLIATVTEASEEERVGPKDEVDYHAKRLRHPDESVRMNAIFELEELLLCGSTYAEPRKAFIIAQLRSMENDPLEDVREVAAESLRKLGDPQHILKVIQPQPAADFLNPYKARELGSQTKECTPPADLEPVYRHVLTLFDSDQEKLRAFAVNFFGATEPVDAARAHLLNAFRDPSAIVRAAAIHALKNLYENNSHDRDPTNDHQAREVAIRMLADPAPEVIIAALETSIYQGEERILPFNVVQPFLTSKHKGIRFAAVRALNFDTTDEAQQVLLELTRDPDPEVRAAAGECLYDAKSDAVRERMIQLLGDNDPTVRIRALQLLGTNPHPTAIPAIKALLTQELDPDVIRVANDSLESQ
jgi:HEAT repeat protein